MKIFLGIMLALLLCQTSYAHSYTGQLYWFTFKVQPDRFATKLWSSLPLSAFNNSEGLIPSAIEIGNNNLAELNSYGVGVLPNSPTVFYINYPDYTGKIQPGCGFVITLIDDPTGSFKYKANVQQANIPDSAMDCSMSGDQNSSDFTIHISSYALSK